MPSNPGDDDRPLTRRDLQEELAIAFAAHVNGTVTRADLQDAKDELKAAARADAKSIRDELRVHFNIAAEKFKRSATASPVTARMRRGR